MYREYAAKFAPTVEPYGGKVLAANDAEVREGSPPFPRFVIGEFPTMDAPAPGTSPKPTRLSSPYA